MAKIAISGFLGGKICQKWKNLAFGWGGGPVPAIQGGWPPHLNFARPPYVEPCTTVENNQKPGPRFLGKATAMATPLSAQTWVALEKCAAAKLDWGEWAGLGVPIWHGPGEGVRTAAAGGLQPEALHRVSIWT